MPKFYHINGQIIPIEQSVLHISDIGLLRGYGIFDYFLAREGHPLFLDDYLDRFYRSAELLDLEIPFSRPVFTQYLYDLLAANEMRDAGIRLLLTGGYSPDGYTPTDPNLAIMVYDLPANTWEFSPTGIKVITVPFQRDLPEVKTTNYAMGIRKLKEVKAANAQDLVYVDGEYLRESARSNFYLVNAEGHIVTTPEKILWGVTRKQILDLAHKNGIVVEEREVHISELATASEAFFTSTTKGAMSIRQVDEQVIGDGKPGPVTTRLQALFIERVKEYLAGKH
jgi:branched-subunit amino acid aminotransferase/4-amino-4-deoxychorismate lyase